MGCDIHAAIEVKDNGTWKAVQYPNRYHGKYKGEPKVTVKMDLGRNYDLFAILADVRNGIGVAGIRTGEAFEPIAPGRGLPLDISEKAKDACDGDHSATWVSISELLACDWTRTRKHRGWVDALTFEKYDRCREWEVGPEQHCGDVGGSSVVKVSEERMRQIVKDIIGDKRGQEFERALKKLPEHTYCLVEWTETYAQSAGQFWILWIPELLKLSAQYGGNVRMVMNFDS